MIILPAIDLINGACVRLYQGDFNKKTVYDENPLKVARSFEAAGAKYLHVVDLDGAQNPSARQDGLIKTIARDTRLSVQTGGGIREAGQIKDYLDNGVARVIVGSMAATAPETVREWLKIFGVSRIVLSLDVFFQDGDFIAALHGWKESGKIKLADFIDFYRAFKGLQILSTDISKDGALEGPNPRLYKKIKELMPGCFLQASGGIRGAEDIKAVEKAGCGGVIIGKALYENRINLADIIREFKQ